MNNEFSLERAIAGEPIETMGKTTALFVAYRPDVTSCKQLIIQIGTDIVMYHANGSYYSSNEHCSYNLRMKPELAKPKPVQELPSELVAFINTFPELNMSNYSDEFRFEFDRDDEVNPCK
jgi:hypothetical protein